MIIYLFCLVEKKNRGKKIVNYVSLLSCPFSKKQKNFIVFEDLLQ